MSININGAVSTAYGYTTPDFNEVAQSENAGAEKAAETTIPKQQTESYKPDLDKIQQMKLDMSGNIAAFKQMVYAMFKDQGSKFFEALGNGNFKVDEATQLSAQQAISEDGEWGVEAVSNRLLEFAKALSGGDPSKIEMLRDAVKAGFGAAAKVWGGDMPGITQQTYARTMELFDDWAREYE